MEIFCHIFYFLYVLNFTYFVIREWNKNTFQTGIKIRNWHNNNKSKVECTPILTQYQVNLPAKTRIYSSSTELRALICSSLIHTNTHTPILNMRGRAADHYLSSLLRTLLCFSGGPVWLYRNLLPVCNCVLTYAYFFGLDLPLSLNLVWIPGT